MGFQAFIPKAPRNPGGQPTVHGMNGVGQPAPQVSDSPNVGGWGGHGPAPVVSPFVAWRRARGVSDANWKDWPLHYKALLYARWAGN